MTMKILLYLLFIIICDSYYINYIKQNRINNIMMIHSNNNNNINMNKFQLYAKKERPLDDLPLELCDENAEQVMNEVRSELGTIFGYDPASQAVGISGKIELIEIDGPTIKVALNGRFWHATDTVVR